MTTRVATTVKNKTAITLAPLLLKTIDKMASDRGLSRSAFITSILEEVARARRDGEITRKINALFADPAAAQAQSDATIGDAGARWDDERW